MKNILILFLFCLPILSFGQTEKSLIRMSDGNFVEKVPECLLPLDTVNYVFNDSLSKENNLKIIKAGGDSIVLKSDSTIVYSGFDRIKQKENLLGWVDSGGVEKQWFVFDLEINFAWELIVLFFFLFLITVLAQEIIRNDFALVFLILSIFVIFAVSVFIEIITAFFSIFISLVVLGILVSAFGFVKLNILKNISLGICIVTQAIFSFWFYSNTEEIFFAVTGGIIFGLFVSYFLKKKKEHKEE